MQPVNLPAESNNIRIRSGRDINEYKCKEEMIFHYVLKRSLIGFNDFFDVPFDKILKTQISGGQSQLNLALLQKKIDQARTVLFLGEPDYIQLYLKYYPIVKEPFLFTDTSDPEVEASETDQPMLNLSSAKR